MDELAGWKKLIRKGETLVEEYNEKHPQDEPIKFTQIKEKWGGLRMYIDSYVPELIEKLEDIEIESYHTCMDCATNDNVKTIPTHGWYMTLCDECRKKEMKRWTKKINFHA